MIRDILILLMIFICTPSVKAEKRPQADCLKCHSKDIERTNRHGGVEKECAKCHVPTGAIHPQNGTTGFTLSSDIPGLCLGCHKDMGEKMKSLPVIHGALTSGSKCITCHFPHSSEKEKLLKMDVNQICLSCHSREIKKDSATISNIGGLLKSAMSVHDPVLSSGCTVCHNPHYGERSFMLAGTFPSKRYDEGTSGNYELCFICHNSELLDSATTIGATKFRNGNKNLHNLHSSGERGRSCLVCHDVHGAAGPHLIKDQVVFGQWEARVIYTPSENGGSCATACHGIKKYDRNIKVSHDK